MWILGLVLLFMTTYELYRFLPKYFFLRYKGHKSDAVMIDFVDKGLVSFGVVPKLNYTIEGVDYKKILPIYSGFVTISNPIVGNNVLIYYNSEKPVECIIKSDFKVLIQILVSIFTYCISIYMIMYPNS